MRTVLSSRPERAFFLASAAACAVLACSSASAQSTSMFGRNLVVNGNAEAGPGTPDTASTARPLPGWTPTGNFTAVRYGASGGVGATDPGPPDRGKNFFAGGPDNAASSAVQTIDVSTGAAAIDAGGVKFTLSAYVGGFSGQRDHAVITATFKDADGGKLAAASIGPVTPEQRKGHTGLLARSASGTVPAKSRSIDVAIVSTRFEGAYNDGYCDDVALVLTK